MVACKFIVYLGLIINPCDISFMETSEFPNKLFGSSKHCSIYFNNGIVKNIENISCDKILNMINEKY